MTAHNESEMHNEYGMSRGVFQMRKEFYKEPIWVLLYEYGRRRKSFISRPLQSNHGRLYLLVAFLSVFMECKRNI